MVRRTMEKGQDQREKVATPKVWAEKERVYIGNGRAKAENNSKSN